MSWADDQEPIERAFIEMLERRQARGYKDFIVEIHDRTIKNNFINSNLEDDEELLPIIDSGIFHIIYDYETWNYEKEFIIITDDICVARISYIYDEGDKYKLLKIESFLSYHDLYWYGLNNCDRIACLEKEWF